MSYKRVLPRDLFNTAKLLKCLGRFELLKIDKQLPFETEFDGEDFRIVQNDDDGSLLCANHRVFLGRYEVVFFTPLNSMDAWPLYGIYQGKEYSVFDDYGDMTYEFKELFLNHWESVNK